MFPVTKKTLDKFLNENQGLEDVISLISPIIAHDDFSPENLAKKACYIAKNICPVLCCNANSFPKTFHCFSNIMNEAKPKGKACILVAQV